MPQKKHDAESCDCQIIHNAVIERVRGKMPREEELGSLSALFKLFGDSTRVKILFGLSEEEMCVCDIAALLGMTVSAVSHQLRVLKQGRLVRSRKAGKSVFYSLDDDHIRRIFDQGLVHIRE